MAQKKALTYAQAKGAPAGFTLQGMLVAAASLARMVYTVATSAATKHYLNASTGLVRIKAVSNGVFVAFSGDASKAPAKADQVLTASGNATDGEQIVIGSRTYTFVDALSEDTGDAVADEILIGADAAATLDNVKAAVNGAAGEGTTYSTGTDAHADVIATTNTDTEQTIEAKFQGAAGNSIATTTDAADLAWGATTLEGGADGNFEEYVPAGGSLDIALDEGTEELSFIADGGNATVVVVEY